MQGTLVIADGVATNRILLKTKLSQSGYGIAVQDTAAAFLATARQVNPVLMILSDTLSDMSATELCATVRADAVLASVPLIAIAARPDGKARRALLAAGADEVFSYPLHQVILQARVRSLIRARTGAEELELRLGAKRALGFSEARPVFAARARVALVAAERSTAESWRERLSDTGEAMELSAYGYGDAMSSIGERAPPDVVVIGLEGPDAAIGLRLLADFRANPATRHTAFLAILATATEEGLAANALDLGAGDLMIHGFDAQELAMRLRNQIAQKQTQDWLRDSVKDGLRAAVLDPMTGLFNRRYAMPYLERLFSQSVQTGRQFAVMIADLDQFKSINDCHGHVAGDRILTETAHRLKDDLRAEDLVARIGGEEFLVVLPDSTREEARITAERLRNRIAGTPFLLPDGEGELRVTISIGVDVWTQDGGPAPPPEDGVRALLKRADKALYQAKNAGRNQVAFAAGTVQT